MSQRVCPRCSEKGLLLTISRSAGIDDFSSGDPTGTLECPGCHTTMEFRACALPICPHPAIHYPLQRFECRDYVGPRHPMYGGKGHMLPSDNGEWVRHADHVQRVEGQAEVLRRRNETIDQLYAKHDTLHAQWERQKGTINYLSEENEELKTKVQVVESQKNQAQMDVAREKRDRWLREIREYNGMPTDAFQEALKPGRIFYQPFPSHAEVTIRSLNERILEQEKEMAEFQRMHTAAVNDLTTELAACRSPLNAAEQERDQPSDELTGARRANAFLWRDLGEFRDQLDTTQKELAAEKLKLHKFREVLIGLTF